MKRRSKIHAKRSHVFYIDQQNPCTFKTTILLLKPFLATSYIANTALLLSSPQKITLDHSEPHTQNKRNGDYKRLNCAGSRNLSVQTAVQENSIMLRYKRKLKGK
jgi:hypothetical protein